MADWHLPEQHWGAICRDIPRFRSAHYGHNPHIGEILVWCNVTQGERALSPLVRALREDNKSMAEYIVGQAGVFHGQLHTPRRLLRLRLDRYASLLSQACDLQRPLDIDIDEIAATPATSMSPVSQIRRRSPEPEPSPPIQARNTKLTSAITARSAAVDV